jgi:hypothetical protein
LSWPCTKRPTGSPVVRMDRRSPSVTECFLGRQTRVFLPSPSLIDEVCGACGGPGPDDGRPSHSGLRRLGSIPRHNKESSVAMTNRPRPTTAKRYCSELGFQQAVARLSRGFHCSRMSEGSGTSATRQVRWSCRNPFLFLNHHGSQTYPPGNGGLPFGPHPHRGFETVTVILPGSLAGPFGASISTRPSTGTASTSIASWINSLPTTTSGASTLDWEVGRRSSDAARAHANRRIFITSPGDRTVPASSTFQLLRNQHFAMVGMIGPGAHFN